MTDSITLLNDVVLDYKTRRPKDCIDASRIINRLYLGSYDNAATCKDGLVNYKITHILTIGYDMPNEFPKDFIYHLIKLQDNALEDISSYFTECFEFIDNALASNNNNRILVHCFAGISRSATIVVAYLMHSMGLSYVESCECVRKARHWINPNSGFRKQLVHLSMNHGLGDEKEAEK
jgi:protein-tyrosine phosphatase